MSTSPDDKADIIALYVAAMLVKFGSQPETFAVFRAWMEAEEKRVAGDPRFREFMGGEPEPVIARELRTAMSPALLGEVSMRLARMISADAVAEWSAMTARKAGLS